MFNILSVDLEEWFVVEALAGRYDYEQWPSLASTVVKNSHRLLNLFQRCDVRATWFVLGYVAESFPSLIREIADAGHEVACHSHRHTKVDRLTEESFRNDTLQAMLAIEKAIGSKPQGYRAPSWSISRRTAWAYRVLAELGFLYDSSIFPIKHDIYGAPDSPRELFKMTFDSGLSLWEMPCTTYRLLGHNLPLAGGGYLRHSPYWYSRTMIRKLNERGEPAMVYVHPWELDPDPPRIEGLSALQRFRTYSSTAVLERKLERLLADFQFTTVLEHVLAHPRKKIGFERT